MMIWLAGIVDFHPPMQDTNSNPSTGTVAIYSIIVGIDQYKAKNAFSILKGAVNDAKSFQSFLTDPHRLGGLQVPSSHIKCLLNEKATRSAILSALKSHFLNNQAIPDHGETAMCLFFAGHGSRIHARDNLLPLDGKVEVICPFDERTRGSDGNYVHAIPDFVLGQFLHQLAEKKGRNIIVILDSCHSGGMGRDTARARTAKTRSLPVPSGLDQHLFEDAINTARPYGVWAPSVSSHVLLAACGQDEQAYESPSQPFHGRFTRSLVTELRRAKLNDITYADLVSRLPTLPMQNPHCGGAYKDRVVFRTDYPGIGRRALALTQQLLLDPTGGDERLRLYSISMGSVEGVRPGTEFSVYGAGNNTVVLGKLVARTVKIHQTLLAPQDTELADIPKGSRAVMKDWKNTDKILRVHTPPGSQHAPGLFQTHTVNPNYVRANSPEAAHISLKRDGFEIVVQWLAGPLAQEQGARETRFPLVPMRSEGRAKPLHLLSVVDGLAHFRYFLERENGNVLLAHCSLEMHRLQGHYPTRRSDLSVGNNGNLVAFGKVELRPERDAKYGFTMRNTSHSDLFPYLFYFEPLKCTIQAWYIPETAYGRPPLHGNSGQLTVGMGGEGAFQFWLPKGKRKSTGFFKLFVSTEYVDLGWIRQEMSPFDSRFEGTDRLFGSHEPLQRSEQWNALRVVLTMTL
ncbi:hypothetical protein B0H17DRAFT_1057312 [Mycena rosella]|uniref:Peptidase C14 caspase domain-containing protein n=1 Tax=Mycena rosella TaxID=1033263 RepID=A0AAD7GH82_MYCRO|nr:hypothetical protein B0H17DRAFT_1057312 [Mycena rosella]